MNMSVGGLQKQHENWKAARERLFGQKPKQEVAPVEIAAPVVLIEDEPKLFDEAAVEEIVAARYAGILKENASLRAALVVAEVDMSMIDIPRRSTKEIITEVLSMYPAIRWVDVRSNRRITSIVAARHACVWEVYVQRPDLSMCQIGRIFGIDHSTVNYVVRSREAAFGDQTAAAVLDRKRQRSHDFHQAHYANRAAE